MKAEQTSRAGNRLLPWVLPIVAALMVTAILIPAEVWHHPITDAVYRGFDANLIYVGEAEGAPSLSLVRVTADSLRLTAPPGARPVVHLLTSPLRFDVEATVRVIASGDAGVPLSLGVWSPRTDSAFILNFEAPHKVITAQTASRGVVRTRTLGPYAPGQAYRLQLAVNAPAGVIQSRLSRTEAPPGGGAMLRLVGGPADPTYRDVVSEPVPVTPGREYRFGGIVKTVSGTDAYKIVMQWLDGNGRLLGHANDWRSVAEVKGWTRREFAAIAPADAALARLDLGSGNGTEILFASLFLREGRQPGGNFLRNADFQQGAAGWLIAGEPSRPLEILSAEDLQFVAAVTASEVPGLFSTLRRSFSVSAWSRSGTTAAEVENYRLILPHQRWQAVRTDDPRARWLTFLLAAAGAMLVIGRAWLWRRDRLAGSAPGPGSMARLRRLVWSSSVSGPLLALFGVYVVGNALLFGLGDLPFDMLSAKVWAYVAAWHGPADLYYRPNTVTLAKVWSGVPYHEAVFPYNFIMAYYLAGLGWAYRLWLAGPGPVLLDSSGLEFVLKSFNVLFAAAAAGLIYFILRAVGQERRPAMTGAALFLFNPAVVFSTSIWGQNHVVSIFLLLLAILATQRGREVLAWFALVASVLTRPQMAVPAIVLGAFLLRKFPVRRNVQSMSWAVVATFLILVPFALAISPSLPVDVTANQFYVQEAGGNEPALTTVSLGAYSLWPLVTGLVGGQEGVARFNLPSASLLFGGISYQLAGQLLSVGALLIPLLLLLARRPAPEQGATSLPLIALGTIAFFVVKTGLAGTHFLIGLPLLILCQRAIGPRASFALVALWTIVTFDSMYGTLAFAVLNTPGVAPALHPSNNLISRLQLFLYTADWSITLHTLVTVLVLVFLTWLAVRSLRGQASPSAH